jgi:hypothetical protein
MVPVVGKDGIDRVPRVSPRTSGVPAIAMQITNHLTDINLNNALSPGKRRQPVRERRIGERITLSGMKHRSLANQEPEPT